MKSRSKSGCIKTKRYVVLRSSKLTSRPLAKQGKVVNMKCSGSSVAAKYAKAAHKKTGRKLKSVFLYRKGRVSRYGISMKLKSGKAKFSAKLTSSKSVGKKSKSKSSKKSRSKSRKSRRRRRKSKKSKKSKSRSKRRTRRRTRKTRKTLRRRPSKRHCPAHSRRSKSGKTCRRTVKRASASIKSARSAVRRASKSLTSAKRALAKSKRSLSKSKPGSKLRAAKKSALRRIRSRVARRRKSLTRAKKTLRKKSRTYKTARSSASKSKK